MVADNTPQRKQLRCPFSGKNLLLKKTKGKGYYYVESPYGWRSRLFLDESTARMFARGMQCEPHKLTEVNNGVRYRITGNGWFSLHFQRKEAALYWADHRMGRPLGRAEPPPQISVKDVTPYGDDPTRDDPFSDMENPTEVAGEIMDLQEKMDRDGK
jgi:hypothetical protein